METHEKRYEEWQILVGIVACGVGLLLVATSEIAGIMDAPARISLCFVGVVGCGAGLICFLVPLGDEEIPVKIKGGQLGTFWLNGRYLIAYEAETASGKKQFRLTSSVPLHPRREAALIRYLVLEGFVGSLWPQLSEEIEAEASWAFFG